MLAGVALCLLLLLLTPRLPIAVFLPLAIATLWLTAGAAPLALWIGPTALGVTGCAIQLAAVALAFAMIRRHNGGRGFWFGADSPAAPAFAWQRTLGLGTAFAALGPPAAVLYLALAASTALHVATHGFVQLDWSGVSLGDRRYQRGDREIRLVGMMHIGDDDAYRALARTFAREATVVLAEGVSDEDGRLGGALDYGRAASALGLSRQQDFDAYLADPDDPTAPPPPWPVVRRADVDTRALSPAAIGWIRWAGSVWDAHDVPSVLTAVRRGIRERDPQADLATFRELLDLRNAHLIEEIRAALGEFERVIVPWGALHLPEVEDAVLSWGFEETSRELHLLVDWRAVAAALR